MKKESGPDNLPDSESLPISNNEFKPSPRGFEVNIVNYEKIYETITNGNDNNGQLDIGGFEPTIDVYTVNIFVKENTFELHGQLFFPDTFDSLKVFKLIAKSYSDLHPQAKVEAGDYKYIITTPHNNRFVLVGFDDSFRLSIGTDDEEPENPPNLDRETYDQVMSDFIELFKLSLNNVYFSIDQDVPERNELRFTAPNEYYRSPNSNTLNSPQNIKDIDVLGVVRQKPIIEDKFIRELVVENLTQKFDDIGGLYEAKKELKKVVYALQNPDLYVKWGTKPPKGVLLHGPPGTGKTILAKAVAAEANATFLYVQSSDIVSKWYGEAEQNANKLFEGAGNIKGPVIIFFDEIDSLTADRDDSNDNNTTKRIQNIILSHIDGFLSKSNVIVMGATNRLDAIDPAITRAGRFDRLIEVGYPDEKARVQIWSIHMGIAERIANRELFEDIDLEELKNLSDGYSGADIAEIIRRVLEEKAHQEAEGLMPTKATTTDIIQVLQVYERMNEN